MNVTNPVSTSSAPSYQYDANSNNQQAGGAPESALKSNFSDSILKAAASPFGLTEDSAQLSGSSASSQDKMSGNSAASAASSGGTDLMSHMKNMLGSIMDSIASVTSAITQAASGALSAATRLIGS